MTYCLSSIVLSIVLQHIYLNTYTYLCYTHFTLDLSVQKLQNEKQRSSLVHKTKKKIFKKNTKSTEKYYTQKIRFELKRKIRKRISNCEKSEKLKGIYAFHLEERARESVSERDREYTIYIVKNKRVVFLYL